MSIKEKGTMDITKMRDIARYSRFLDIISKFSEKVSPYIDIDKKDLMDGLDAIYSVKKHGRKFDIDKHSTKKYNVDKEVEESDEKISRDIDEYLEKRFEKKYDVDKEAKKISNDVDEENEPWQLVALKKYCREYMLPKYVFKSTNDAIVVMKKLATTKTNETRIVIDERHAKYRADKLMVVDIIDKYHPHRLMEITKSYFDDGFTYTVGTIACDNSFDKDLHKICTKGIHYFKTVEAAFYFNLELNQEFDGIIKEWHSDGEIQLETQFKSGILNGVSRRYDCGRLESETQYKNGVCHGLSRHHDSYGITTETHYKNGLRDGFSKIYDNGIMVCKILYKDDEEIYRTPNHPVELYCKKSTWPIC